MDQDVFDSPSPPDIQQLRNEAAREIQRRIKGRQTRRKLTKRSPRYGKWATPTTEREKMRRWTDLTKMYDEEDPIRGYEQFSIYPERLLPGQKGGTTSSERKAATTIQRITRGHKSRDKTKIKRRRQQNPNIVDTLLYTPEDIGWMIGEEYLQKYSPYTVGWIIFKKASCTNLCVTSNTFSNEYIQQYIKHDIDIPIEDKIPYFFTDSEKEKFTLDNGFSGFVVSHPHVRKRRQIPGFTWMIGDKDNYYTPDDIVKDIKRGSFYHDIYIPPGVTIDFLVENRRRYNIVFNDPNDEYRYIRRLEEEEEKDENERMAEYLDDIEQYEPEPEIDPFTDESEIDNWTDCYDCGKPLYLGKYSDYVGEEYFPTLINEKWYCNDCAEERKVMSGGYRRRKKTFRKRYRL